MKKKLSLIVLGVIAATAIGLVIGAIMKATL